MSSSITVLPLYFEVVWSRLKSLWPGTYKSLRIRYLNNALFIYCKELSGLFTGHYLDLWAPTKHGPSQFWYIIFALFPVSSGYFSHKFAFLTNMFNSCFVVHALGKSMEAPTGDTWRPNTSSGPDKSISEPCQTISWQILFQVIPLWPGTLTKLNDFNLASEWSCILVLFWKLLKD